MLNFELFSVASYSNAAFGSHLQILMITDVVANILPNCILIMYSEI
jgi:hypothetical protein